MTSCFARCSWRSTGEDQGHAHLTSQPCPRCRACSRETSLMFRKIMRFSACLFAGNRLGSSGHGPSKLWVKKDDSWWEELAKLVMQCKFGPLSGCCPERHPQALGQGGLQRTRVVKALSRVPDDQGHAAGSMKNWRSEKEHSEKVT